MMRVAYFDCFSGAGGDMIVAALLDAGASFDHLREQLDTLGVSDFEISAEKINKQGFAATQFHVRAGADQPHRHLHHVMEIIRGGKLSDRVVGQVEQIFTRLAEAEAAVHGCSIEKVHFHEVGAIDAIVDVTAACLALENLGIEQVVCSAIPVGSGSVKCEHGVIPVPAPATVQLLKGVPIAQCSETGELTTPTAAAVLTTLATSFALPPAMTLRQVGHGAGQRDGDKLPNLLRVLIGDSQDIAADDTVLVLEANIDDQTAELVAHAIELLLEQGALDAYCQPIYMKKGRLGMLLTVLCEPDRLEDMEALIFSETTTFGIRRRLLQRSKLQRRHDTVHLAAGEVRIKVGTRQGKVQTASPEFEDCRKLAAKTHQPVKEIMSLAMKAWHDSRDHH